MPSSDSTGDRASAMAFSAPEALSIYIAGNSTASEGSISHSVFSPSAAPCVSAGKTSVFRTTAQMPTAARMSGTMRSQTSFIF